MWPAPKEGPEPPSPPYGFRRSYTMLGPLGWTWLASVVAVPPRTLEEAGTLLGELLLCRAAEGGR